MDDLAWLLWLWKWSDCWVLGLALKGTTRRNLHSNKNQDVKIMNSPEVSIGENKKLTWVSLRVKACYGMVLVHSQIRVKWKDLSWVLCKQDTFFKFMLCGKRLEHRTRPPKFKEQNGQSQLDETRRKAAEHTHLNDETERTQQHVDDGKQFQAATHFEVDFLVNVATKGVAIAVAARRRLPLPTLCNSHFEASQCNLIAGSPVSRSR